MLKLLVRSKMAKAFHVFFHVPQLLSTVGSLHYETKWKEAPGQNECKKQEEPSSTREQLLGNSRINCLKRHKRWGTRRSSSHTPSTWTSLRLRCIVAITGQYFTGRRNWWNADTFSHCREMPCRAEKLVTWTEQSKQFLNFCRKGMKSLPWLPHQPCLLQQMWTGASTFDSRLIMKTRMYYSALSIRAFLHVGWKEGRFFIL